MKTIGLLLMSVLICLSFFAETNAQRRGRGNTTRETKPPTTDSASKTGVPTERGKNQTKSTKLSANQQENVDKLKDDLSAIKSGSSVTQAQKDALKNSLITLAEGTVKPDKALVQTLAGDLAQALADGNISGQEQINLANDLQKVMNSANIPKDEVTAAIANIQAILESSNISSTDVQTIVNDLKAITNTAKGNFPRRNRS
jgi:Skp family chaperone for outer membrane proteins